jgi:hypothetical protein
MRTVLRLVVSCIAAALWTAPGHAEVTVTFANPQQYADAESRSANVQKDLRAYLRRLSARLARGVDLNVTVLDLDLAGFDMSTRGPNNVRLLTSATWPKIKLRYVLTKNRRIVATGKEWLTDQFYRSRAGLASASDPLRYEKNMLDDWFRTRFASHLKTGG